jgi:putative endonuclease
MTGEADRRETARDNSTPVSRYFVYIMASKHRTLYTGVTGDLERRVFEHRHGITGGFTRKYNCHRLVFFEAADDAMAAIVREKEIKGWARRKKCALIEERNPDWKDLSEEWR